MPGVSPRQRWLGLAALSGVLLATVPFAISGWIARNDVMTSLTGLSAYGIPAELAHLDYSAGLYSASFTATLDLKGRWLPTPLEIVGEVEHHFTSATVITRPISAWWQQASGTARKVIQAEVPRLTSTFRLCLSCPGFTGQHTVSAPAMRGRIAGHLIEAGPMALVVTAGATDWVLTGDIEHLRLRSATELQQLQLHALDFSLRREPGVAGLPSLQLTARAGDFHTGGVLGEFEGLSLAADYSDERWLLTVQASRLDSRGVPRLRTRAFEGSIRMRPYHDMRVNIALQAEDGPVHGSLTMQYDSDLSAWNGGQFELELPNSVATVLDLFVPALWQRWRAHGMVTATANGWRVAGGR